MLRCILPLLLIVNCSVATAAEWGSIGGQIIVEGEIPERVVLIAKDAAIRDKEVCSAEEHLAEDLIIDTDSRGLADVFVHLTKAPMKIHPDYVVPPKEGVLFCPHWEYLNVYLTCGQLHPAVASKRQVSPIPSGILCREYAMLLGERELGS